MSHLLWQHWKQQMYMNEVYQQKHLPLIGRLVTTEQKFWKGQSYTHWADKQEQTDRQTNRLYYADSTVYCITSSYLTNRLHFSMCVYCNRSQMTSQRVKNKKVRHETKLSGVNVILYTLWRLLRSITVHTHRKMLSICFIYI